MILQPRLTDVVLNTVSVNFDTTYHNVAGRNELILVSVGMDIAAGAAANFGYIDVYVGPDSNYALNPVVATSGIAVSPAAAAERNYVIHNLVFYVPNGHYWRLARNQQNCTFNVVNTTVTEVRL